MKWHSNSHPISDIVDWDSNNRLELQPDFQRNVVWSRAAQIMLIDTILKNIPIPKVYIKTYIKDMNTYRVVIDGQQRLTAILLFINDEFALKSPYDGEYIDLFFSQLPEDVKNKILSYEIDMNELENPTADDVRDLYARVNKYTVQLNKQELRKADFAGEFISLAEELSILDFFDNSKIFTPQQRRRMNDVEYIEELLSILVEGIQDKKEQLDMFCEKYRVLNEKSEELSQRFENILSDIQRIFNEDFEIKNTRFKQKSDFYSLFACIDELHISQKRIDLDKVETVRNSLKKLDKYIEPQAEDEIYREYAMRCLSDANSKSSREWRKNYLMDYIKECYV